MRELRIENADNCALMRAAVVTAQNIAHQDAFVLLGAIIGAPLTIVIVAAVAFRR